MHPISKKTGTEEGARCEDIFSKHVTKGDILNFGKTQSEETYRPLNPDQTSMTLEIYTSTEDDPNVYHRQQLHVSGQNGRGYVRYNRWNEQERDLQDALWGHWARGGSSWDKYKQSLKS